MITDKLDDPNDALSFSGVMLMPEEVAEHVEGLLDRPKPVLTIPRWRGRFARFFDRHRGSPSGSTPLLMRDALRRQRAFKKKVEAGKWPPTESAPPRVEPRTTLATQGRALPHGARPDGPLRLAPLPGRLVPGEIQPDARAALDRARRDRLPAAPDPIGLVGARAGGGPLHAVVRAASRQGGLLRGQRVLGRTDTGAGWRSWPWKTSSCALGPSRRCPTRSAPCRMPPSTWSSWTSWSPRRPRVSTCSNRR